MMAGVCTVGPIDFPDSLFSFSARKLKVIFILHFLFTPQWAGK